MDSHEVNKLARDLARLLAKLADLYGELSSHMRRKLEAIKQADSDQVTSIVAQEMALAHTIAEREGLRRHITQKLAGLLNIPTDTQRSLRLSELVDHLPEPYRSQVLSAATGLKARVAEIQEQQKTVRLITEEMLKHIGAVVSTMTAPLPDTETYERTGVQPNGRKPHIFEAVG